MFLAIMYNYNKNISTRGHLLPHVIIFYNIYTAYIMYYYIDMNYIIRHNKAYLVSPIVFTISDKNDMLHLLSILKY